MCARAVGVLGSIRVVCECVGHTLRCMTGSRRSYSIGRSYWPPTLAAIRERKAKASRHRCVRMYIPCVPLNSMDSFDVLKLIALVHELGVVQLFCSWYNAKFSAGILIPFDA